MFFSGIIIKNVADDQKKKMLYFGSDNCPGKFPADSPLLCSIILSDHVQDTNTCTLVEIVVKLCSAS